MILFSINLHICYNNIHLNTLHKIGSIDIDLKSAVNPFVLKCTLCLPPENIRKVYRFLMFSGGRKKMHSERMGECWNFDNWN